MTQVLIFSNRLIIIKFSLACKLLDLSVIMNSESFKIGILNLVTKLNNFNLTYYKISANYHLCT